MLRECILCNSRNVQLLYILKNVYRVKQFKRYLSAEGGSLNDLQDNILLFCNNCGLVFRSSKPRYGELRKNYENRYEFTEDEIRTKLDAHYRSTAVMRIFEEIGWIKEQIPRFKDNSWRVLDIGSREGYTVKTFSDMGWDAYGIEPTETLVQSVRKVYGLNLKSGMYEEDSYPSDFFDLIYASSVVHRFDDIGLFFRSAYRHLKKGGILFIRVFNVYDIKMNGLTAQHRVYFSSGTLKQAAQKYGFREIKIESERPIGPYAGLICALFEKIDIPDSFEFMCMDNFNLVRKAVTGADYCVIEQNRKLDPDSFILSIVYFLENLGLPTFNRIFLKANRGYNLLKKRRNNKDK